MVKIINYNYIYMYMYCICTYTGQAPGAFQVVGSKSSNSTTSSPTPSNTSSDSGIAGEGVCVWGECVRV